MKFVIIRKADKDTEASMMPSQALVEAMMAYNEEMVKAGVMVGGEGLHPSIRGFRVKFEGGKPQVTDGPFAETKELVAGFTLIEVASREEAMAWVRRWPPLDGDGAVELEVRQVYEMEELGEGFTPEMLDLEKRLRDQMQKQA